MSEVQITTRVSAEEAGKLAALAKANERSVSAQLRVALREHLEREAQNATS